MRLHFELVLVLSNEDSVQQSEIVVCRVRVERIGSRRVSIEVGSTSILSGLEEMFFPLLSSPIFALFQLREELVVCRQVRRISLFFDTTFLSRTTTFHFELVFLVIELVEIGVVVRTSGLAEEKPSSIDRQRFDDLSLVKTRQREFVRRESKRTRQFNDRMFVDDVVQRRASFPRVQLEVRC